MSWCIDVHAQDDSTRLSVPASATRFLPSADLPRVPEVMVPKTKQDSATGILSDKDSLLVKQKHKWHQRKDSIVNKPTLMKAMKQLIPHGSVALGNEYGFLPYTVNTSSPAYAFSAEGQLQARLLGLPLTISFFYSSQKNLIGINNYFRLSYDASRYKEELNGKLGTQLGAYKDQLGRLQSQRQGLMQKMAYSDYLAGIAPDKWPVDSTRLPSLNVDTLYQKPSLPDTSRRPSLQLPVDTAGKADRFRHKKDSVRHAYDRYKMRYDSVKAVIQEIQQKVAELEQLMQGDYKAWAGKSPYLSKFQNFMAGVRKLEVGLCYPNYSTFLTNNMPLRGINFEYARNNRFFALSYGTTVSSLLYNTRTIDGFLQNVRNTYNYFDFNNLVAGRKVLSVKTGIGTKEGNHVFAGILLGRGLSSYLLTGNEDVNTLSRESNVVLELDGRYKLGALTTLDVVLGKSSVQGEDISYGAIQAAMKELFSSYRSYAALTRITTQIKPTHTNLTATVRWVDPFFKSYGLGFIRSDNLRYELKLDQPLGKRLRYTGMLRYEEDNLLRLMNYKNTFYSMSNMVSLRLGRSLMIRAGYTPLIQRLRSESGLQVNNNYITTGVLTYSPKSRRATWQFNMLYNYYRINSDTQQVNFQNFAYTHQVSFKSGFRTGLTVSWFKNTLTDTLNNNNVFLGVLDLGYQFKNGSTCSIGAKSAYKWQGDFYPGFIARGSIRLASGLFWENQVEKFIVGDLFNGYDLEKLKKFPYNCTTKLIFNF